VAISGEAGVPPRFIIVILYLDIIIVGFSWILWSNPFSLQLKVRDYQLGLRGDIYSVHKRMTSSLVSLVCTPCLVRPGKSRCLPERLTSFGVLTKQLKQDEQNQRVLGPEDRNIP
jgi:hypothetical protein